MKRRGLGWAWLLAAPATPGLLVALPMTLRDWWLNPGRIFRSPDGTNWEAVLSTAWSWFWPVALVTAVLMLGFHAARVLLRSG